MTHSVQIDTPSKARLTHLSSEALHGVLLIAQEGAGVGYRARSDAGAPTLTTIPSSVAQRRRPMVTRPTRRRPRPTPASMQIDGTQLHGTLDVQALLRAQGVRPLQRLEDLAGDFWPPDENVDDFVETIYRWRREER